MSYYDELRAKTNANPQGQNFVPAGNFPPKKKNSWIASVILIILFVVGAGVYLKISSDRQAENKALDKAKILSAVQAFPVAPMTSAEKADLLKKLQAVPVPGTQVVKTATSTAIKK